MKSVMVCALMISVVIGSMGGAQDEVQKRLQRANGTPTSAWATDDGALIGVESIDGTRFGIYQSLGALLLFVKGQVNYGIVAMNEGGQKYFVGKSDARAPYMESNMFGAFEVKEVQVKSQLWIAPNGTKWRESIDNSGNITKVQVTP